MPAGRRTGRRRALAPARRVRRAFALGTALSSVLALSVALSRRAVRSAEARYPASGELIDVGDAVVHVVRLGSAVPGRLPLVLIHGADGTTHEFTETIAEALAADHEVVVVDRPGHGWSTIPAGASPCVGLNARLVREAVRAVGIERCVVLGHSYGAATALRWTLDHAEDVAGLVLVSPAAYWRWRAPRWPLAVPGIPVLGPALAEALVVPFGRAVFAVTARRAFHPHPVPRAYAGFARALYLRPRQFAVLAEEYRRLRDDLEAMRGRYGEIDVPSAIVVGDHDLVTHPVRQAEALASELRGSTLRVLPRVGHELHWHAPAAVLGAVREVEARLASGV